MKGLTAEDRKLIVITVVATVAANLLTVVMVGLAIIIAHNLRVTPDTPTKQKLFYWITDAI